MPAEGALENFKLLVLGSDELQKKLRGITDSNEFVARVVELGAANGCDLNAEGVQEAMRLGRRIWLDGNL